VSSADKPFPQLSQAAFSHLSLETSLVFGIEPMWRTCSKLKDVIMVFHRTLSQNGIQESQFVIATLLDALVAV
jgi:hypothetical protein